MCETMARETAVGVAPHSLRAVTPEELCHAIALAAGLITPLHIHVSEQVAEVEACLAWSGARPVAWLLDHAPVGENWCLVHATHSDATERRRLAASGAVVGLCQTTEANLGDGIFPFSDFQGAGGVFGIGSDSNVGTSPVEELRWLDYTGRLERRSRNVTRGKPGGSIGAGLLAGAWAGGARALGRACGKIAPGFLADLVALDADHPALVGRAGLGWLDAWIFSGNSAPVRDVMVRGRFLVRDGAHIDGERIRRAFAATMRRLLAA
jgi:formimidoylglutamate deiminase